MEKPCFMGIRGGVCNNEYLVETRFYILIGIIVSLWFITIVKNKFDKQNYEWRMRKW